METPIRLLYNGILVPGARLARPLLVRFSPKLRRGVEARRDVLARWRRAARRTEGGAPRIWVHAASAGESLQARPLAEAIREARPEAALFYTFFSPSAERYVANWETPDVADYLPFDARARIRRLVELLAPDAVILVGAELWPNLVWEVDESGAKLAQACCRFGSGAGRLRWPMRIATAALYRHFDAVGAVAKEDAEVLRELGLEPERISVTGDTRIDASLARLEGVAEPPPWQPPVGVGPVVVAGSTWPPDERLVLDAVARLREGMPDLLAIVAPHEPTRAGLERVEREAGARGMRAVRLSRTEAEVERADIVLVDRVGVLYRLYAVADAAYVGGGLEGSVHNTMEPAAHGVPVAIGPRHGSPHEVLAMERNGGLAVVESSAELAAAWGGWLGEPARGREAGRAARATLGDLTGATGRTIDFLRRRGIPV